MQGAAAWETLTVCPAMMNVPLRAAPVFAAAVKVTVPGPVPEVTLGVSQVLKLVTAQAPQVLLAVSVTESGPPASV